MVELLKVHGSSNSFFLLDQTSSEKKFTQDELISLTKFIADPANNVLDGADGMLIIDSASDEKSLASMEVINADGSIASMCGNGLRTVSRFLSEKFGQEMFHVETPQKSLAVSHAEAIFDQLETFSVEISPVSFAQKDVGFKNLGHDHIQETILPEIHPTLRFTAVAVPNPHLIAFVDQETLDSALEKQIGEQLNSANPYFPDGVNVSFVGLLGKNKIFVKTFERGVGFTNACGTAMAASSLVTAITHPEFIKYGEKNTVLNPGGMVQTIVHPSEEQHRIDLIGNATFTHKIEIERTALLNHAFENAQITETGEQDIYDKFIASLN